MARDDDWLGPCPCYWLRCWRRTRCFTKLRSWNSAWWFDRGINDPKQIFQRWSQFWSKVCQDCKGQCLVVHLLGRLARTVRLPIQPLINTLLRLSRLPNVVFSILFWYINIQLLHGNMSLQRYAESYGRCNKGERWPAWKVLSTRYKLEDLTPANSRGFLKLWIISAQLTLAEFGGYISGEYLFETIQQPPGYRPVSRSHSQ